MRKVPIQVEPAEAIQDTDRSIATKEDRATAGGTSVEPEACQEELERWRDRALRLQAEMENYRKRQRRLAEEQIAASRERVLGSLLEVADNLQRALNAADEGRAGDESGRALQAGIEVTLQSVRQALEREGVEPLEAEGERFDPDWHEAVAVVSHEEANVTPQSIVEVTERGYRLGERVLRPARVVVAV